MKLLTVVCAAVMLIGCAEPIIKTEIVTVNKPIPFIPSPPIVPTIEYQVDKLTFEDMASPGKVGQAYVHDMTFLRKRIEIDDMILEQYQDGSVNFDEIEAKINELYGDIQKPVKTNVKISVDPK